MQIRYYRAFDWKHILIYGGINAFILVVCALAISYNYFVTHQGIPVGGLISMGAALLGFIIPTIILMRLRWQFEQAITFYTKQGVAVLTKQVSIPDMDKLKSSIEDVLDFAIAFWSKEYPQYAAGIADLFNGGFLTLVPAKLELDAKVGGVFYHWARGLTYGNSMLISWLPDITFETEMQLVKHEAGHVCLNATNVAPDGDTQHAVFAKDGYNY